MPCEGVLSAAFHGGHHLRPCRRALSAVLFLTHDLSHIPEPEEQTKSRADYGGHGRSGDAGQDRVSASARMHRVVSGRKQEWLSLHICIFKFLSKLLICPFKTEGSPDILIFTRPSSSASPVSLRCREPEPMKDRPEGKIRRTYLCISKSGSLPCL